jgi:NAD(P)-dependent dehydrogenase (short-subunit alcohol dehydrogenase family)
MRLQGKLALVTGAGRGIGRATALLFAQEGASVVAADLSQAEADAVVAEITAAGGKAVALAADLSDPAETKAMMDKAIAAFGGLDIVVNNAGVPKAPGATLDLDDWDAWDKVWDVNVRSVFICCQQAAKWMKDHGGGKIVNLGSQTGIAGQPYVNAYGPSKAAIHNMTRSLAVEWARFKINVNCVAPCWTRTPRLEAAVDKGVVSWDEIAKRCPLGRAAEPEEVAKAILFMASEDADFITGVILPVDGGWLAQGYAAS